MPLGFRPGAFCCASGSGLAQAFDVSKRVAGHGGAARTRQMLYPLHNPPPATKLVVLSSIASSRW
jgi:hypothetical protein